MRPARDGVRPRALAGFTAAVVGYVPDGRAEEAIGGSVEKVRGIGLDGAPKLLALPVQKLHLSQGLVFLPLPAGRGVWVRTERALLDQPVGLQTLRLVQLIGEIRLHRNETAAHAAMAHSPGRNSER